MVLTTSSQFGERGSVTNSTGSGGGSWGGNQGPEHAVPQSHTPKHLVLQLGLREVQTQRSPVCLAVWLES